MKNNQKKNTCIFIGIFLAVGLIIRFLLRDFVSRDMEVFLLDWYERAKTMGFSGALSTQIGNYNFLYQFFIALFSQIPVNAIYQYKLLSVIFDIVLSFGAYKLASVLSDYKKGIAAFGITFLAPIAWLNSAMWGQCESIYIAFIIWALYFLHKDRDILAYIFVGLAYSFKLQAVFIFPYLGYRYLKNIKKKPSDIFKFGLIPLTQLVCGIPNIICGRNPLDMISVYFGQLGEYSEYMYMNYPSFWTFFDMDGNSGKYIAYAVTAVIFAALLVWFLKSKKKNTGVDMLWIAVIFSYAAVLFLPSMHERYGYIYEMLLIVLVCVVNRGWIQVFFTQLLTLETYLYYLSSVRFNIKYLSVINILVFASLCVYYWLYRKGKLTEFSLFERIKEKHSENRESVEEKSVKLAPTLIEDREGFRIKKYLKKNNIIAMVLITLFFFVNALIGLGSLEAPQTSRYFGNEYETNELYLRFNEYHDFTNIRVFLGCSNKCGLNFYGAENGQWVDLKTEASWGSVFAWNNLEIDFTTSEFCLIFSGDSVEIREVVCIDSDGNMVTPDNTLEYPEVFDEQDIYVNPPTYYNQTMFDEVYHGRTGYETLHGLPIYEVSHPPLGKVFIAIGIAIFGMNPFGWRIMCVIFGTAMIPLIYLFVLRLTKKNHLAALASFLLATEFMHFTLSRIATIDIIIAFLVMGMFYSVYAFIQENRYRYLWIGGIFSALGISTKWTGIYALFGLAIILFIYMILKAKELKWFKFISTCALAFIVLPLTVYVLSYIPYVISDPSKGLLQHVIENNEFMLRYHSNVTATHPYQSSWYEWLINWVPLMDSRTYIGDYTSAVGTFVSPLVSILGLVCVGHNLYRAFAKKDNRSLYLCLMYFIMLAPWWLITRTVFIYQYFICTQAMILMICYSIGTMNYKREKQVALSVAVISMILFAVFYPIISGALVKREYMELIRLLPKWYF